MTLVESCHHHLEQARDLALRLEPHAFRCAHTVCYSSSIGQHLRHCVDHVESFLDGLAGGRIDYDLRIRGLNSETDPTEAVERIDRNLRRLQDLSVNESAAISVKLDCGEIDDPWKHSSVGRELQFLVSHLVHHFAIIAMMCRTQGIEPGEEFGFAPSTLRHRACA